MKNLTGKRSLPVACALAWIWKARTLYDLSWPWRVLDLRFYLHTRILFSVSGSFYKVMSSHFYRRLSSRALNTKWRAIIHHKVRCKAVELEVPSSPHSKSLHVFLGLSQFTGSLWSVPFAMIYNKLTALGTWHFFGEFEVVSVNNIYIWTSIVQGELETTLKGRQTDRLVLCAVQFLSTVLKNLHNVTVSKFSSSWGVSHSYQFSFSCKQNHFHAFMSLCVFTFMFAGFCCKINSWNSPTFLFSFLSFSLTHSVFSFSNSIDTETTGNL